MMRNLIFIIPLLLLVGCGVNSIFRKNHASKKYLLNSLNYNKAYSIQSVKVSDSSVYKILEVAFDRLNDCKYFNPAIRNQYAMFIGSPKNLIDTYYIDNMISIRNAVNADFTDYKILNIEPHIGGFYFKGHLITVPLSVDSIKNSYYSFYPFIDVNNCENITVNATLLPDDELYHSSLWFKIQEDEYKITEDNSCKGTLLIK